MEKLNSQLLYCKIISIYEGGHTMNDRQFIKQLRKLKNLKAIRDSLTLISILYICAALFIIYILFSRENPLYIAAIILFVISIVYVALVKKKGKKLDDKIKIFIGENITKTVIAERMEIIDYIPTDFIGKKWRDMSNILPDYDRISGSDFIKANYRGQEILYCDLKLEYETTDNDGHSQWRTNFKGPFIKLTLKQEIQGFVKIKEGSHLRKNGLLSDLINSAKDAVGIKSNSDQIEVENEAFNNKFKITTDNDQLAFYILTPQFMENILELDNKAQGNTRINFKKNAAFIAINNGRDAFEITKALFTTKGLEQARQSMRYDLDIILGMIDEILEKDRLFS